MDEFERRLLRRLVFRPESLSRNRNFDAFDDPTLRRLRRTARHLRSVIDELRTVPVRHVSADPDGAEGWTLTVVRPRESATREVRLSADEFDLLAEHPAGAALRLTRRRARR